MTGFAIEETIRIAAPPEAVWKLLVDPHTWAHWWPGCLEAETKDRKTLHDGSELRLRLKLGPLQLPFVARVEAATPPKYLVWSATSFGVSGRHAFYVDPRADGSAVRQQEHFTGAGVLPFRLLRFDRATRTMFQKNLRGLKRFAERAL